MDDFKEERIVACRGELPRQYNEDHALTLFIEAEDGRTHTFKLDGSQARQLRHDICGATQSGFPSTVKR